MAIKKIKIGSTSYDVQDARLPAVTTTDNGKVLTVVSGAWAASNGGGGDTSGCVHKTGDENVAGNKTFTDDIIVGSAGNIKYSGGGGGGFTKGVKTFGTMSGQTITFTGLSGEPKAFVLSAITDTIGRSNYTEGVVSVVMDSTGCQAIYNTGTQHNHSSAFSTSYSNGTLVITAPSGVTWPSGNIDFGLVYYYGDGTLTFKTSQIQPGSGMTAVTFTGTGLTEVPAMYACFLESAVNSESYRRVALFTNSALDEGDTQVSLGITFYSQLMADTTSSFSVSYNNGLYINSGGTNAGGYFHNPGTYVLYYLMASDVAGGGSGSYQSLGDELDDKYTLPSSGIPKSDLASAVQTSLGKADTALQSYTETDPVFLASAAHGISSTDISNWNAKQKAITVSTSTPTSSQGSNGDIWIVI